MDLNLEAEARQVLAEADCICQAEEIQAACLRIAADLEREYADKNPLVIIVMKGALVAAADILKHVRFPFELDYLHATRYRGRMSGHDLIWKRQPDKEIGGRHVLLIDDILDEGRTLAEVCQVLQQRQPASLKVAVLTEKVHGRRDPGAFADFVGVQLPDRYVFGCGMDYKEYWRQLPAIYAVRGA